MGLTSGLFSAHFFMMKLHLHAVNALYVPANHRAMCSCAAIVGFTTVTGISTMPKRNMASETIGNAFLVLRSGITKLRHTTSESCEHAFGNMRKGQREFACSEFSNLMDKQNRRLNLCFKSKLKTSREDSISGWHENLDVFLSSAHDS